MAGGAGLPRPRLDALALAPPGVDVPLAWRWGDREGIVMRGPLRVDSAKRRPGAAEGSSAQSLKRPSIPSEASRLGYMVVGSHWSWALCQFDSTQSN